MDAASSVKPSGSGMEPFERVWRDFDQFFGGVFRRFLGGGGTSGERSGSGAGAGAGAGADGGLAMNFLPQMDVEETDAETVVRVDLPGIAPESVEVTVAGNSLILRGERREEKTDKKRNFSRVERFVGRFYREVPLPRGADLDNIKAVGADGVLTVTIPHKAEANARRIAVRQQPAAGGSAHWGTEPETHPATPALQSPAPIRSQGS
jgi:HSP20 family protein